MECDLENCEYLQLAKEEMEILKSEIKKDLEIIIGNYKEIEKIASDKKGVIGNLNRVVTLSNEIKQINFKMLKLID
jgi:hypothetical protein